MHAPEDWHESLVNRLDPGVERRPEYGPIWLDISSRTAQVAGSNKEIHLAPKEFQILWLLVRAQGNPIPVSEMENFVYESVPEEKDAPPITNSFVEIISRMRKKLEVATDGKVTITHGPQGFSTYNLSLKKDK